MSTKRIGVFAILVGFFIFAGCRLWQPEVIYHTPGPTLSPQERDQLWHRLCQQSGSTGCLQVNVRAASNNKPVERAVIAVEGPQGIMGFTDAEGVYRQSQLDPGIYVVRMTILHPDSSISEEQEQRAEISAGEIKHVDFVAQLY